MTFNTATFITPIEEAIRIINERRKDPLLVSKVESYLNNDIPLHFKYEKPTLYLSRHLATPNYEAIHFMNLCKPLNLPTVIGQDTKGKFVSNNTLKLPLGKLSVVKGYARNSDEIVENFTVIDFAIAQGKPFSEIKTKFGDNLVNFHTELFDKSFPVHVKICDESDWVDRNSRENLKEQYKRMLSLLVVHGIMFESYVPEEQDFVDEILLPAFNEIVSIFGCKPLITQLVPFEREYERNWNGYPHAVYPFVKEKFTTIT